MAICHDGCLDLCVWGCYVSEFQCCGDNNWGGLPTLAPSVRFPRYTCRVTVSAGLDLWFHPARLFLYSYFSSIYLSYLAYSLLGFIVLWCHIVVCSLGYCLFIYCYCKAWLPKVIPFWWMELILESLLVKLKSRRKSRQFRANAQHSKGTERWGGEYSYLIQFLDTWNASLSLFLVDEMFLI